jgi:hypothetical protein
MIAKDIRAFVDGCRIPMLPTSLSCGEDDCQHIRTGREHAKVGLAGAMGAILGYGDRLRGSNGLFGCEQGMRRGTCK